MCTRQKSNGPAVGGRSRLIKLVKLPVDGALPSGLQETTGYDFFEHESATGRPQPLDPAASEPQRRAFMEKVYRLAGDLAQLLDPLSAASAAPTEPEPEPEPELPRVFLSYAQRDRERLGPAVRLIESAGFRSGWTKTA